MPVHQGIIPNACEVVKLKLFCLINSPYEIKYRWKAFTDISILIIYLFIYFIYLFIYLFSKKTALTNIQSKKLINIMQQQINEISNTCIMYCKIKLIHKNIKK